MICMTTMTIGSALPNPADDVQHIYCPALAGLSVRLADAAFLMPRIDQNRHVKEASGHGHWAACIAADPFGSNAAFFAGLRASGYTGVVNWPSSILLEGQTRQEFSSIPATPATEYAYLARARDAGLQTRAFFLTPEQATEAARMADAVVVGSAIVNRMAEPGADTEGVVDFVRSLSSAVRTARTV